jgi:hypothetical protein
MDTDVDVSGDKNIQNLFKDREFQALNCDASGGCEVA